MLTSEQLLNEFAQSRSEEAFREIVDRHLNLVFATAMRMAQGDSHFARDVAQVVFRDLALKAAKIPSGILLAGWLYRHTNFTATKMLRAERRRIAREKSSLDYQSMSVPEDFGDRLDPALEKLGEEDRTVIVLRFLEANNLRQVGQALGITEDAAQKRVSRALDKLRAILAGSGVAVTVTGLASALGTQALAAPEGLASTLARGALATAAISSSTSMTTLFSTFKAKAALFVLAAVGVATPLLLQRQALNEARAERTNLAQTIGELRGTIAELEKANASDELARLRRENLELHKLRAEIGALRERARTLESENAALAAANAADGKPTPPQVRITVRYAEMSTAVFGELQTLGISVPADHTTATILTREKAQAMEDFLKEQQGVDLLSSPALTTVDRQQARVAVEDNIVIDGKAIPVGQVLEVVPEVAADRESTTLKINATITEYLGVSENDHVPRFRVRQAQSEGRIRSSDTLLLQALPTGQSDEAPKKLVVMVGSSVVNPDGTLHQAAQ